LKTPSVYRGDGKQAMCFAWPVGHSYSKKTAMVLYAQNPIGFAVGLGHTTCFIIRLKTRVEFSHISVRLK